MTEPGAIPPFYDERRKKMIKKSTIKIEDFGDGNQTEYLYSEDLLNDRQQTLSSVFFTGDGALIEKVENKYDDEGRLTLSESFNGDLELIQRDSYEYSEQDGLRKVVQTLSYPDGSTDRYIEFFKNDNLITSEFYHDGSIAEIEKNIFVDDKLTQHVIVDAEGRELQKEKFSLEGNLLTINKYMNDELVSSETCIVEEDRILEELFVSEGVENRTNYRYDAEGNMIEEMLYIDALPVSTKHCRYESGLLIEEVIEDFTASRSITLRNMQYDSQGRLILEKDQYNHMRFIYEEVS